MAEVNTPDVHGGSNIEKSESLLHIQSTNSEVNEHLSCHNESSKSAQTKIKTDYLENLLDSPVDQWKKGSLKEKIVPRLQDDSQNIGVLSCNSGSSGGTTSLDDASNKIQNIETSISSFSTENNTKSKVTDISSSSANSVEPSVESSIQNSANSTNLFKESHKNNLQETSTSMQFICEYGSDSDDDLQIVACSNNILESSEHNEKDVMDYRSQVFFSEDDDEDSDSSDDKSDSDSSSTTSSSSSSSSSSVSSENASAVINRNVANNQENAAKSNKNRSLMTRGEISIEDLPPIEDLCISVPKEECEEVGKITNIVDQLVVVQAHKNTRPLNLDSVLFLDHGKQALGQIFDVFGQVSEPLYCIRFNSREHIEKRGIQKDMIVYSAPNTQHSSFVFMSHLLNVKGSDASWEDNNEPPAKFLDYSDDEEERKAKQLLKSNDKKTSDGDPERPKKKKVRSNSFERRMNERNLRMTALHANQPPTPTIRNTASSNNNNNNNGIPRPPFENGPWCSGALPSSHTFHRPSRPPPRPCNPSPQRLIHPPTFTLPPRQRFDMPPYPIFSSPPPPPAFSSPHGNSAGGPPMSPMFPPFQAPPFLPFSHTFPSPIPPFNPSHPPPSFGFPPAFPPQMPRQRPPPPP